MPVYRDGLVTAVVLGTARGWPGVRVAGGWGGVSGAVWAVLGAAGGL